MKNFILWLVFVWCGGSQAADKNPVIGNPNAPKGGQIIVGGGAYPKSLNAPISGDLYSSLVYELVVENMCETNLETGEHVPLLAERWDISADKKVFTFYLNKKAKFSDGTPVTTKDVQAFWDIVHNPDNIIGAVRSSFDRFSKIEVVDSHTVKVFAKQVHFTNMDTICGSFNVTSHKFWLAKGKNYNKSFNSDIFGSGPYLLKKVKKGRSIKLVRDKNYWGAHLPQNIGRYNFDTVIFRTVEDDMIKFELLKKGDLDMISISQPKRWIEGTKTEKFNKNWIIAQRVDSQSPEGFAGIAINTRRKPYDDVRVRKALAHTLNRKKFIKDLFYGMYKPTASYWPNSIFADPKRKPTEFDLKTARQLLKEAGFRKVNKDGILIKDGKPFVMDYHYVRKDSERYLTIWKEDLRKAGIDIKLKQITWASLIKKWNKYEYELSELGWTGSLNPDPYEMWHSKFKDQPSGNNLPGFSDSRLDALIMKIGPIFDRNKRAPLFHEMDAILTSSYPYLLRWRLGYLRKAYWHKFGFIKGTVPRYGGTLWHYAWYDAAKHKALKTAVKADKALAKPTGVRGPHD